MIVLNSLAELRRFTESTRVDEGKQYEVVIPCKSDRTVVKVGQKTSSDELSLSDVAKVMRLLTPAHSKKSSNVRVF